MNEVLRMIRVLGLRHTVRLLRAYRLGWGSILSGYFTTRAMQALFNVGFFDELCEKGTVDPLAFSASRNLDAAILKSLCDMLFSLSILSKNGVEYSLDSKGKLLVEVLRGWFDLAYGYEPVFHSLENLLTKKKEYGKDVYRLSDSVAKGSGEMENWVYFPLAIDIIAKNRFSTVLDLGCGDGTFLRHLCEKNQKVTGIGVDIAPDAIARGEEKVKQAHLQDRIHLFVEDISKLDRLPDSLHGVDAATVFFVLHELLFAGDEYVVELLRSFRNLFPGVPLIVFEAVRPAPEEMRKRPEMGVYYYMYHDITHQRPVGREKWKALFRTAGFDAVEERYLRLIRTAIFTLR